MKADVKEKWVRALRSGAYRQGIGALRQREPDGTDSYCCLGVLCDVVMPERWGRTTGQMKYRHGDFRTVGGPDASVRKEVGIDDSEVAVLISFNDEDGNTFDDIAAWIEENL